jgi:hypothetical protein
MMDLLSELTWGKAVIGILIFVGTFVANIALVSFILVKIPADYFKKNRKTQFWAGPNPALHAAKMIGKNILGIFLVLLGIILSIPGVPGQGLLTILLGIVLMDFPGKRRLERKLLSRQQIVKTIDKLRKKFDKPPLELD